MIKGLSLFANVGIAETYLKDVGVDTVVANELLEERANFYRYLYPSCDMIQGDIKDPDVYKKVIYLRGADYQKLVHIKDGIERFVADNAAYKNTIVQFDFNPMNGF